MLEVGSWKLEALYRAESRYWKLDVGCWMLDVGCWMLDVGCWMLDVGCWMLDVGSRKLEAGSEKLEVGSWKWEVGSGRLEVGFYIVIKFIVMIKSFKDLEVHKAAFSLAMDIFWRTRDFPKEEVYSLTTQIVRSSRSVSANISEGWGKRNYESVFKQQLVTALGSNAETEDWLDYDLACNYLSNEEYLELIKRNNKVGRMLTKLYQNWKSY